MSGFFNTVTRHITAFLSSKIKRRSLVLIFLLIGALAEYLVLGLARRTFVFYTNDNVSVVVEDRMLKRSVSREINITRYTEETLLGPASPDLQPLFPRETRLNSLLYRNGVVFVDFSADAAFPSAEGGSTRDNFFTLYTGILRNFSFVNDVRFFIEGKAAYAGKFGKLADESFTAKLKNLLFCR
ncbi:MAG: GerMN domain-containing protein [Treponema sp.]|jgi:hypothetical protein|nr:GerMN domain-containing protein [Treponema sp.]